MSSLDAVSASAMVAVCGYWLFAWLLVGRDPHRGTIVPRYEPPDGLSPAMVRYVWKQCFDERVFWAAVLSLVAKGLAELKSDGDDVRLRGTGARNCPSRAEEENLLMKRLHLGSKGQGCRMNVLDDKVSLALSDMAVLLKRAAGNRWFRDNLSFVVAGCCLSVLAIFVVARPYTKDALISLFGGAGMLAPGAFYLYFLLLRIQDVARAIRGHADRVLIRRAGLLLFLVIPCAAAVMVGTSVLTANFGWPIAAIAGLFVALALIFSHLMKTRSRQGRLLMDQIEGFRIFLKSVEQHPLNRDEGPGTDAGAYEKYLPYAVALEVEQGWSDRFLALTSTVHRAETLVAAHTFYLGMWNGKPVEIVFRPEPASKGQL